MITPRGLLGCMVRPDILLILLLVIAGFCALPLVSYATIDPNDQDPVAQPASLSDQITLARSGDIGDGGRFGGGLRGVRSSSIGDMNDPH